MNKRFVLIDDILLVDRKLIRHPSRDAIRAEAGREAQARPAHGEVADQIPEQGGELGDGGDEGEEGAVELFGGFGHS